MRSAERGLATGRAALWSSSSFALLGAFFFSGLLALLATGDLDVRLANIPGDDNPLFYAHFYRESAAFAGDIVATYGQGQVLATLQNWLPLLGMEVGVSPARTIWVLVLAQSVLFGLALLDFSSAVGRRWEVALILPFAFAAQPWAWNVANYGGACFFSSPLATYLALPFALFAAAATIRGKTWKGGIFLLVCGLIHVTITLYMVLILAGFWALESSSSSSGWHQLVKRGLFLVAVAGISVIPRLSLQVGGNQMLTPAEWVKGISLVNTHIFPWRYPAKWDQMMPAFFSFLFLAGLALRGVRKLHPAFASFWLSGLFSLGLMALASAVGIYWEVPSFLQLYPLRISLLLVLFSLPPVLLYLVDKLRARRWLEGWAAAALLLSLGFSSYGIFWGPLLALCLTDLAEGQLGPMKLPVGEGLASGLRTAAGLLLGGWTAAAWSLGGEHLSLLAPRAGQDVWRYGAGLAATGVVFARFSESRVGWVGSGVALSAFALAADYLHIGNPGFGLVQMVALGVGVVLLWVGGMPAAAQWIGRIRSALGHRWVPVVAVGIALGGLALLKARQSGAETDRPDLRANYQAQNWARENTPADAVFIGYGQPWRTYSHRRLVDPCLQGWYVYSKDRRAKGFDDQVLKFYGLEEVSRRMDIQELIQAQREAYLSLGEQGILRLARQFGGNYIIRTVDHPLNFPEVYRNEQFVIYRFPEPGDPSTEGSGT